MSGSIGKQVHVPRRTPELAEFIGIMMGDGGMSRYQATITLNLVDDIEYSSFVIQTIERLFGYTPGVILRVDKTAIRIVMSRVKLVRFLETLGLPTGDKIRNGLNIPQWIIESDDFLIPCIRGLVDTDGSVFTHRYISKRKTYAYKKLSFTSASTPLLYSVGTALKKYGMRPRIGSNRDIRLDSIADMKRYFSIIGTHNPKHLRRYAS